MTLEEFSSVQVHKELALLFSAKGPDSFGDMTAVVLTHVLWGPSYLGLFCILSQQTFSVQSQLGSILGLMSQETKIKNSL